MAEMPWVRFFPSDWLGGTRGMSAAETGVYITLIATMYERGEPIPEEHARLARLCGASNASFRSTLEALVSEGKIVRTEVGLWNDRVQKEAVYRSEKSEVGKQAAFVRWGTKPNKNKVPDDANAMPTHSDGNANQKPEPEREEEPIGSLSETSSDTRKKRKDYPGAFETSWLSYPRDPNMSKAEAFDAWKKLDAADKDALAASIPAFVAYCRANPDYRPIHMCRYIAKRRFDGHGQPQASAPIDETTWLSRMKFARERHTWSTPEWGPRPGESGCLVPKQLLETGDGQDWREWEHAA